MGWNAVEAVDDAVEATRRFLFPFGLVRWAKLSLLVLLMGGSASAGASVPVSPDARLGSVSGLSGALVAGTGAESAAGEFDTVVSDLLGGTPDESVILAVALVGIVGVIALSVASLSLRLVFYYALRTNEVRLWRPFLARFRQAAGLFVASIGLWSLAVAPVALAALVAVAGETPIGWEPIDSLAVTVGSLTSGPTVAVGLFGSAVVLVATLALRLTYEFVVPAMVVGETGVFVGWRRVWRAVSGEWAELAVYLAVHFFVRLGTAIVGGIAFVIAGSAVVVVAGSALLLAAVPLGGLGALAGTSVGIATVVLVVLVGAVTLTVLILPVSVVTQSYLIAYEVATLGGIDPGLAFFPRDAESPSTEFD